MTADRLEDMVRSGSNGSSRRGVLAGLSSGLLAGWALGIRSEGAAAKKGKKKKRKRCCRATCAGRVCGGDNLCN